MTHSDYHKLVDRGRKAGLGTAELYQALSTRQPQPGDPTMTQADSNGYISRPGPQGRPVLQPQASRPL